MLKILGKANKDGLVENVTIRSDSLELLNDVVYELENYLPRNERREWKIEQSTDGKDVFWNLGVSNKELGEIIFAFACRS